jgi:hypothetical protein
MPGARPNYPRTQAGKTPPRPPPAFSLSPGGGGEAADAEAIYNLFDFKNYVIKIML